MPVSIIANYRYLDMQERNRLLADNLARLIDVQRTGRGSVSLPARRTLQALAAELVAARTSAGMSQQDVAGRMHTTKSAISRLESGSRTYPRLSTIEKYALAVGARVEIRIRVQR